MSNIPPDPYPPQGYPPESYPPMPPDRDPYATGPGAVSNRVTPPAVALLVVAALNLVLSLILVVVGIGYSQMPADKLEEMMERQNPAQFQNMKQNGITVDTILKIYIYGGLGGGAVGLFVSLLTALGAIRMMMLRSYGLAVFVSVLAAIPCISPSSCCGIGEVIGIWSLVVLFSPDVRAAFR